MYRRIATSGVYNEDIFTVLLLILYLNTYFLFASTFDRIVLVSSAAVGKAGSPADARARNAYRFFNPLARFIHAVMHDAQGTVRLFRSF